MDLAVDRELIGQVPIALELIARIVLAAISQTDLEQIVQVPIDRVLADRIALEVEDRRLETWETFWEWISLCDQPNVRAVLVEAVIGLALVATVQGAPTEAVIGLVLVAIGQGDPVGAVTGQALAIIDQVVPVKVATGRIALIG